MKISRLKKDVLFGISVAQGIKMTTTKDDMKVVRCILGRDENNVSGVLRFLGVASSPLNKAAKVGVLIELTR